MIYFTNTNLRKPHMTFIGRWSPLHKGHLALLQKKIKEHPSVPILVMVRDTNTDSYPATIRAEYIKIWMQKSGVHGTIMIIPNVEGVYWGRKVGYNVGVIDVDEKTKKISGSAIRRKIVSKKSLWKNDVAHAPAAALLSPQISKILDQGKVIWLTGCPSSGKTTLAHSLQTRLAGQYPYLKTQILDGDDMRASPLSRGTGFSPEDRAEHIRKMAHLAAMFANHGICVICAFVSPERKIRAEIKKRIGAKRFTEVYVKASLKTRLKRDKKGMYKKAISGQIKNFTGYSAPYEPPHASAVICDTDKQSINESVGLIISRVFSSH
jgi:adenylyl-sulfate kinase